MNSARSIFKNTAIFIVLTVPLLTFAAPLYQPGETLNPSCLPTDGDCTVSSPSTTFSTTTTDYWMSQKYLLPNLSGIGSTTGTTTFLGNAAFNKNIVIGNFTRIDPTNAFFSFSDSGGNEHFGYNLGAFSVSNGSGNTTFNVDGSGLTTIHVPLGGAKISLNPSGDSYFNGGNIGVGTSSPYAKLAVVGETVAEYFTATSTSATSTFPNVSVSRILVGSDYVTDITGSGLSVVDGVLTASGVFSTTSSDYHFNTRLAATSTLNNINVLGGLATIGSTTGTTTFPGAVGIGTSSPFTTFGLSGTAFFESAGEGTVSVGKVASRLLELSGQTITTVLNIKNRDSAFDINGESANIRFSDSNSTFKSLAGHFYRNANGRYTGSPAGEAFELASANDIYIYTATSTLRVFAATTTFAGGNVGIGTTSPYAALSVTNTGTIPSFVVEDSASPDITPFIIDANGSVGIGTTTPTSPLTVASQSFSSAGLLVDANNDAYQAIIRLNRTANNRAAQIEYSLGGTTSWYSGILRYGGSPNTSYSISTGSDTVLAAPAFTITTAGNVGIGTTSPFATLSVNPIAGAASNQFVVGSSTGTSFIINNSGKVGVGSTTPWATFAVNPIAGQAANQFVVGSSTVTSLIVKNNGSVGIGTNNPAFALDVTSGNSNSNIIRVNASAGNGNSSFVANRTLTSNSSALTLTTGGTSDWLIGMPYATLTTSGSDFNIADGSNNIRFLINKTTGNIGIGTTTPSNKLQVSNTSGGSQLRFDDSDSGDGGGYLTSAGPGNFFMSGGSEYSGSAWTAKSTGAGVIGAGAAAVGQLNFYTNGSLTAGNTFTPTERMRISAAGGLSFGNAYVSTDAGVNNMIIAGNVGIGTTSSMKKLSILDTAAPQLLLTGNGSDGSGVYIGSVNEGANTNEGAISFGSEFAFAGGVISSWTARSTSFGALHVDNGDLNYYADSGLSNGTTFTPTSRLTVTSTGNVGIGTSTPSTKLQVASSLTRYVSLLDTNATISNIFRVDDNSAANVFTLENRDITATTDHGVDIDYRLANDTSTNALNAGTIRLAKENAWTTTAATNDSYFAFSPATDGNTTERMRIVGSTGNVGIGTSTPVAKLDILPDISSIDLVVGGNNSGGTGRTNSVVKAARVGSAHYLNTEEPVSVFTSSNDSTSNVLNIGGSSSILNAVTDLRFFTAANNSTISGTERMRITSAGNIGIGTTSPIALFTVSGGNIEIGTTTGSTAGNITINGRRLLNTYTVNNGSSDQSNLFFGEDAGNYTLSSSNGQNASFGYQTLTNITAGIGNSVVGFRAGGQVTSGIQNAGIGSSACRGITSGSFNTCLGSSAGNSGSSGGTQIATVSYATGVGFGAYTSRSNAMVLGGLGTDYADVVIGTSTPFARLGIQGFYGSTTPLFDIASTTSSVFATSSLFRVNYDGNVGVGSSTPSSRFSVTQSANTAAGGLWIAETGNTDFRSMYMDTSGILSFNGGDTAGALNTATLNAAGAWTNASDRSYKENIVDLGSKYGLATVLAAQPRFYEMKGTHIPQVGFIAQELKIVVPEVVDGKDGSMGISYGNLVAVAFQAIKELSVKVDALAANTLTSLKSLFVKELHVEEKLCVDDVCIGKEQLKQMLLQAGASRIKPQEEAPKVEEPKHEEAETATTTATSTTATTTPPASEPEETATTTASSTPPVVEQPIATSTPEVAQPEEPKKEEVSSTTPPVVEEPKKEETTVASSTPNETQP